MVVRKNVLSLCYQINHREIITPTKHKKMTSTKTIINGKTVGNGKWKFASIQNYCAKKGIQLTSASYQSYEMNYGFDYEHLDVVTGKVKATHNSDPMRSMLGM